MTKPRLGVAIIMDNISTPESEANVTALKNAFDTTGFEVHVHRNCDVNVSHLFINLFPETLCTLHGS